MKEFLCILTPGRAGFPGDATPGEMAIVGDHFAHLRRMLGRGELFLAGRTQEDENPVGIVILRASDLETARAMMDDDPAVRAGVFKAEIRPYQIALLEGRD